MRFPPLPSEFSQTMSCIGHIHFQEAKHVVFVATESANIHGGQARLWVVNDLIIDRFHLASLSVVSCLNNMPNCYIAKVIFRIIWIIRSTHNASKRPNDKLSCRAESACTILSNNEHEPIQLVATRSAPASCYVSHNTAPGFGSSS